MANTTFTTLSTFTSPWFVQARKCLNINERLLWSRSPTHLRWGHSFSYISNNWRGIPLRSYETILKYMRRTKTNPKDGPGLKVSASLIRKEYKNGQKVSDEKMSQLKVKRHDTLPLWNYTILPRKMWTYLWLAPKVQYLVTGNCTSNKITGTLLLTQLKTWMAETIRIALALVKEGLPVEIHDAEELRSRLLGMDNMGVIPIARLRFTATPRQSSLKRRLVEAAGVEPAVFLFFTIILKG